MGNPVLTTMTIEQAKQKQFELTEAIAEEFTGREFFHKGTSAWFPDWAVQCKRTKWNGCWPAFSVWKPVPSYAGPEQGRYGQR